LQQRLRHGPPAPVATPAAAPADGRAVAAPTTVAEDPGPGRWTLESIRTTFDWLKDYTRRGVWRLLHRCDLRLRSATVQQFSPDPDYPAKCADLEMALWEAHRYPRSVTAVFRDQMGFTRWPDPGPDWGVARPVADRRGAKQGRWRLMGALNPFTGQVTYWDNYIIGRAKVIACSEQLVAAYPWARRLYAIPDHWSIHKHPDVRAALKAWPPIEPVWLPTYAPWLNPIEKLWRWLRQDVLKLHRWADDGKTLRARVHAFLDQFAQGSERLLEYVGLRGSGYLARMIHGP
jgi:hypothetical protein